MNIKNTKEFYNSLIDVFSYRYPRFFEENVGLFKVLHTFEDKLPLLEVLLERDLLVGATLKKSSSEAQAVIAKQMYNQLKEKDLVIGKAKTTYSNIPMELPEIKQDRPFIIGDHGGYYAPIVQYLFHTYGDQLIGMTEHTLNGEERLFQYAARHTQHIPYLSTARVDLKERSDKEIAAAISDEIIQKIDTSGYFNLTSRRTKEIILLIGYGTMGMHAAQRLREIGVHAEIIVSDASYKKMAFATQDGFQNVSQEFKEILPFVDLIILATNVIKGEDPVLNAEHFSLLKKNACLTSMTSMDDEVRQDELISAGVIKPYGIDSHYGMYKGPTGKEFSLFLNGKPANVGLANGGASESICMVEAAGLAGAFKIAEEGHDAILDEMDKEIISSLWLKYFHQDFHVSRLNKQAEHDERRRKIAA